MHDFIGDIHGHADKLEELLVKMGYTLKGNAYAHPDRKAFFVGDYIDRGPKIKRTLKIVRSMVENQYAIALMGNHEYNALCFNARNKTGGHLRKHSIKNILQHYETLKQFQNKQDEYDDYLKWFKTLPLFYETTSFRAVHAAWDVQSIRFLRDHLFQSKMTDELIEQSVVKGSPFYDAIDTVLKGKEIKLPKGHSFTDKDGTERRDIRIKWWEDPSRSTYQQISIEPLENFEDSPVDVSGLKTVDFYKPDNIPIFFGHYWLKGNPMLYRGDICCLDYSVAKHGFLAAYRFDGEKVLDQAKFVFV
jgi:Calcineurin-like phosphoesterase